MQPIGWFVQHLQRADRDDSEIGRPIEFAGPRRLNSVDGQTIRASVIQPTFDQKFQPPPNSKEHAIGDGRLLQAIIRARRKTPRVLY
jgi:hypothetical protein